MSSAKSPQQADSPVVRTLKRSVLRAIEYVPPVRRRLLASTDYVLLPPGAGQERLGGNGWEDPKTVGRQDKIWSRLVTRAIDGSPRADISAVLDALGRYTAAGDRVLEVGCGSGYFSRIVAHSFPDVEYIGVDFSAQMITLAQQRYPETTFVQGDATNLQSAPGAFDAVLDGAALIHIPDWRRALSEYRRVSKGPVILSSLTITESGESRRLWKYAYGSPVFENIFSRDELADACQELGLRLVRRVTTLDYDLEPHIGISTTSELWVFVPAEVAAQASTSSSPR